MTDHPPFAPPHPGEADMALLLPQSERKRTGHLFNDCPALDVVAPGARKACKPCLARYEGIGAVANQHQRAFDAAWYAQAAAAEPAAPAYAQAAQAAEGEVWEAVARQDRPAAKPAHRPNKFAGRCVACNQQVPAGEGWLTGRQGAWTVSHANFDAGGCPPSPPDLGYDRGGAPEDAKPVAPGYYALETKEDARQPVAFYRVEVGRPGTRWDGFTFLSRLIGGQGYVPVKGASKAPLLARIAADPMAASVLYGRTSGRCGRCNTELSDQDSIDAGIGPVCASKGF